MNYTPKDGFPYYFELVKNSDCIDLFESRENFNFLASIDEERGDYRYALDKWSIKQVVGHITDHERIKMHRAFLLSRKQAVQLWGYDQESLVKNSRFNEFNLQQLVNDLQAVRMASLHFIQSLSKDQLNLIGRAESHEITLEDFLKSIIGHELHHINLLNERYI